MKKFGVIFSQDYVGGPSAEIKNLDFFGIAYGYDINDITEIRSMEIGESYTIDAPELQVVVRIE